MLDDFTSDFDVLCVAVCSFCAVQIYSFNGLEPLPVVPARKSVNRAVWQDKFWSSSAPATFRGNQQYSCSIVVPLRRPTADRGAIVQAALLSLQTIFRLGFKYSKAGVMLLDLNSDLPEYQQGELDLDGDESSGLQEEKVQLMLALYAVNQRYGKGTLKIGSGGFDSGRSVWAMTQQRRTLGFTACIEDISVSRA